MSFIRIIPINLFNLCHLKCSLDQKYERRPAGTPPWRYRVVIQKFTQPEIGD
jgi:hypothetical protein